MHSSVKQIKQKGATKMQIERYFNHSEGTFPLPKEIAEWYGPFGFPDIPEDRPYTTSNFVQGLDGLGSFRELKGHAGGMEVSRSPEDRWFMDFYRAHHDAQIVAANTLREEPGLDGLGWDYRIEDELLLRYRLETLKLGKTKVLILTGSGKVDLRFNVFNSNAVEPWIVTSRDGAKALEPQIKAHAGTPVKLVVIGQGPEIDLRLMMRALRKEHGVKTLLCEGGPNFYGQLLDQRLIDEDFRTESAQVMGRSTNPEVPRPTTYGNVSYIPETAPWFKLVSLHASTPYHLFKRLRYVGTRRFN